MTLIKQLIIAHYFVIINQDVTTIIIVIIIIVTITIKIIILITTTPCHVHAPIFNKNDNSHLVSLECEHSRSTRPYKTGPHNS